MATSQSTIDTITNWYQSNLGRAPDAAGLSNWSAALESGANKDSLFSSFQNDAAKEISARASTGPGLIDTAPAPSPSSPPNINSWYQSSFGRDADAGGLAAWESAAKATTDYDGLYKKFIAEGAKNNERVRAAPSWREASTYGGPTSQYGNTSVDEWGRNVLGRELTAQEVAKYSPAYDAASKAGDMAGANKVYEQFLSDNAGSIKNSLSAAEASQLAFGRQPVNRNGPTLLNTGDLTQRTINRPTETVAGQMESLLDADSPYLQQARARAQRILAGRGLVNSTMAGTAGEDAAIAAALNIATPDAAAYNKAADYNAALINQATMYNADTQNAFTQKDMDRRQQFSLAQMEDGTRRWLAEKDSQEARYRADLDYRRTMDANRDSLVNNILMSGDSISPDRKAAMLEQLGMGTSAKRAADGTFVPGSGMAGAVYVIDDVAQELKQATQQAGRNAGGGFFAEGGEGGSGEGGDGGDGGDGGGEGGVSI